jgi:isopenicillin N synthase-like dioxygenase
LCAPRNYLPIKEFEVMTLKAHVPTSADLVGVPVIDIAPFLRNTDERDRVVAEIGTACERVGFFVITGHGVSMDLVTRMYTITQKFFALPNQIKRESLSPTGNMFRGYSHRSAETAEGVYDIAEAFEIARYDDATAATAAGYGPKWTDGYDVNVWPSLPDGFQSVWTEYYTTMNDMAEQLMRLLAAALELPAEWFADKFDRHTSYMAANHYVAQPHLPSEGDIRRAAHTDTGSLTILYQDGAPGGLQVRDKGGQWCDVPALPESFVINLGDLLAKWTNDRWVATEHRVINPPREFAGTDRISIPYFQHPNFDAQIECIPSCTGPDNPPKYDPVLAGDWSKYVETLERRNNG